MTQSPNQLANLKLGAPPFDSERAKIAGRKGGIKSGESKRNLKEIREWAEQNLFTERGQNKTPLYEMLFKKLEQLSSQGNIKAIEMLLNYSGLKPVEKVENVNPQVQKIFITKEDNKEVNKLIDEFIDN